MMSQQRLPFYNALAAGFALVFSILPRLRTYIVRTLQHFLPNLQAKSIARSKLIDSSIQCIYLEITT